MYKLLNEQHEGAIKDLQAEMEGSQKEASTLRWQHANFVEKVKVFEISNEELVMATNDQTSQVQQKIDRIDQLRAEINKVQAMSDRWKRKIDQLASEKETAQAQQASVEVQLMVLKDKANKRSRLNNELRAQLSSALAEQDALGNECEAIKAQLSTTSTDTEEMVV
ncbi:uncharacterized protein [Nicotiana sylvestris]|uniref:uncharacterized protein n=1 Tax=Nicotiana sylvestris TaxID=4096 RepID=UPI00388C96D8